MITKNAGSRAILIGFLSFVGLGLTSGLIGLAWPSMQKDFNLPLDGINIINFLQPIAYSLSSFYIGRLMARLGSNRTLLLGAVLIAVSMFGIAASPSWYILVFFAFIGGFAGIVDAGLNMYVAAYHSPQQMSWLHASFGIGITIGPLIMTYFLQQQIGWRGGYIFVGVVLIGVILLIALTGNEWRNEGFQTSENKPVRRANFGQTMRVPAVWFTMATFTLYVGTEIGIGLWAYTIMKEGRGIQPEIAGLWVSVYWGVFTGGRIFFGLIANRFKIDHILRVCSLGMIVGTALFAWNVIPVIGFLGLIIVGGAQAPIFPMLMANTANRVGAQHAENSVSLQMGAVGIGGAVLPSLIGTFGRIYGLETMTVLFFLVAILVFICHELTLLPHPAEPMLSAED